MSLNGREHGEDVVVNVQHLVESTPLRIKSILKNKRGPTQYWQGVTNKVAHHSVTTAVSVHIKIYPLTSMQSAELNTYPLIINERSDCFLKSLCIYLSRQPSFQILAKPRAEPHNNSAVQTLIEITQITMQCKENVFCNLLKAKEIRVLSSPKKRL